MPFSLKDGVSMYSYVIGIKLVLSFMEDWSFFYQYKCEVEPFTISLMHSNEFNFINLFPPVLKMH